MAQLDKELFIEYIYWIFLILLHFYSSFYLNKTVIQLNARIFILNLFYTESKSLKEQERIIKYALENFSKKI